MKFKLIILLCIGLNVGFGTGCKKSEIVEDEDAATEMAQNIGDSMASVDESAGDSSGNIASYNEAARKTFARLAPEELIDSGVLSNILLPKAEGVIVPVTTRLPEHGLRQISVVIQAVQVKQ